MRVELGLECCVDCTAIGDLVSVNQIYEDVEFSSLKSLKKSFIAPFVVSTGHETNCVPEYISCAPGNKFFHNDCRHWFTEAFLLAAVLFVSIETPRFRYSSKLLMKSFRS